ncbi:hypothetical protein DSO57_1022658 [Entomophthora muscae]|uniref:Uncharacterized protein n=1 Tax=Entomophthora muscae TaxID=34485 RepID=A0ACC2T2Z3_9FUNG|nr:hypothetical protein DSO57_1022658 [Entomophthora muscae]
MATVKIFSVDMGAVAASPRHKSVPNGCPSGLPTTIILGRRGEERLEGFTTHQRPISQIGLRKTQPQLLDPQSFPLQA